MARSHPLHSLTHAEIQAELRRRERRIKTLERRRNRLLAKAAEVERQIHENGGRTASGTVRRARNEMSLVESLRALLKGRKMSVTDAAAAVQKAGYVSPSPNFRTMVNATLLNKANFKRVERGVYTAA